MEELEGYKLLQRFHRQFQLGKKLLYSYVPAIIYREVASRQPPQAKSSL
jgi:hypothetical protein